MKTFKILLSLIIALLVFGSCDKVEFGNEFLEKQPSVDVTKDTIFGDYELAFRYLAKGYSTLPYGLNLDWGAKDNKLGMDILESLTDLNYSFLSWSGVNQLYYNGQYGAAVENTSSNTKYHYSKEDSWVGIRIGWYFIENADKIPAPDEATKKNIKRLKAEAKMIIALHYCDMYRHFGGLPWVDRTYNSSETTVKLERLKSKATLNNIVNLIDEAAEDLPWVLPNVATEDGRFTKASAMGLKARILLFGASPLFNRKGGPYLDQNGASTNQFTWHGGEDLSMWNDAAEACKTLLDEISAKGGYALVTNSSLTGAAKYKADFRRAYYARGNGEVLISTRARYKSGGYWATNYYFYQSAGGYGIGCPTKEYVDMFPMADGTPIKESTTYNENVNPWVGRDPRLYETVLVNGDDYQGRKAELYVGGRERTSLAANASKSGFGLRKFLLDRNDATSIQSIVQWPYLRLAEIYLSYAEALNEANGFPTTEAYAAVDRVRARVGLKGLKKGMRREEFREAILTERALEFGYEEVRWFDLVRWEKSDLFLKPLHGVNTTLNPDNTLTYENVELPLRFWQKPEVPWTPKWYLSAFPPTEVNKGYGLTQNPGW